MALLAFIGGLSAIGKTTLLAQLPGRNQTWLGLSAGQLIAEELRLAALPTDDATEVFRYQDALVRSYQRRAHAVALPIVMDGHFALPTRGGWLTVPIDVFRALAPRTLVVLQAEPVTVRRRRIERDGTAPSQAEIDAGVVAETEAARAVATALGVELHEWPAEPATARHLTRMIADVTRDPQG